MAYSGDLAWRTRAGDEVAARLGEPMTKDLSAQALRTALDPAGEWMPSVLAAADRRLTEVRRHVPDAGGLVIATDQDSARAYAALLRKISGRGADGRAVRREGRVEEDRRVHRLARPAGWWRCGWCREGVDVPRLAVGVYATTTSTPLFFAQAVGPVRPGPGPRRDGVGVPAVGAACCSGFAAEMEVERDHVLGRRITDEDDLFAAEQDLLDRANADVGASDELVGTFAGARLAGALRPGASTTAASSATPARCTSGRRRRWTSSASPACSSPTRCASCSSTARRSPSYDGSRGADRAPRSPPTSSWPILRRELNGLVAAWHHRTGQAHGVTHSALRKELRWTGRRDRELRAAPRPDQPPPRVGVAPYRLVPATDSKGRAPTAGRGATSRGCPTRWPSAQCSSACTDAPQSRWANATGGPSGSAR